LTCALGACSDGSSRPPPPDSCGAVPADALNTVAHLADPHYCMINYAQNVTRARQLAFAPNGDLFVASQGQVVVLFDDNGDGVSDAGERSTFAAMADLNHGLALTATHVYASSPSAVYRWAYKTGDRVAAGPMETVLSGISADGHATRTLLVDAQNRLYVSIGSVGNVDPPADPNTPATSRALIRRYNLASIPAGGYLFGDDDGGEGFAYGLRNEVGLTIDSKNRLWGVENGRDNLMVGGDIHYDNPAEEVNLFDLNRPGRNYGYPFCWSEGIWMDTAMAKGPGTQHLDPDQPGAFTEAKCQDKTAVVPPAFVLGAHLAPLDIVEYRGVGYPADMEGDFFVTAHGSWNREIGQVGELIIRLKMGASSPTEVVNFLGKESPTTHEVIQGDWAVRPVSIRIDKAGLLTFTDDTTGTVSKIGYRP
ncbi:MAG TPA: PQQ-dependent sugar dehydrogenase, partial [Polyangia bacterium]